MIDAGPSFGAVSRYSVAMPAKFWLTFCLFTGPTIIMSACPPLVNTDLTRFRIRDSVKAPVAVGSTGTPTAPEENPGVVASPWAPA